MRTTHIDDFHYSCAEVFCALYSAFPVRYLLLVEDITGPIKWDMTGLPDRRSQACFETFVWLAEHDLLSFRTVEPRDIGVEGAVLTQKAFVLLTGHITWETGDSISRINALLDARRSRAYGDLGLIVNDLFQANCQWVAPKASEPIAKSEPLILGD
ncbi:hypothetical protein R0135_00915 [Congregibacter variabilis]|uniref:Uncharacterized protein n=1 Tax=Congregibacter variabilis TaxID=3081200 RepID=A0ABZ0I4R7_9GAMM|nr:hypothetical protein R0135_00915 [Congregibacter sp. IMCC43200]